MTREALGTSIGAPWEPVRDALSHKKGGGHQGREVDDPGIRSPAGGGDCGSRCGGHPSRESPGRAGPAGGESPVTVGAAGPACASDTGYEVGVEYSSTGFPVDRVVELGEDDALLHTVPLSAFQGSATRCSASGPARRARTAGGRRVPSGCLGGDLPVWEVSVDKSMALRSELAVERHSRRERRALGREACARRSASEVIT